MKWKSNTIFTILSWSRLHGIKTIFVKEFKDIKSFLKIDAIESQALLQLQFFKNTHNREEANNSQLMLLT